MAALLNITDPEISPQTPLDPKKDLVHRRIVLVGKTGSGKSATGNTILGEKRFRSEFSFSSVKEESKIETAVVAARNLTVIDTPGIFDTQSGKPEELVKEIGKSIYLSAPGPHAFLYVQPINIRFTEHEENVIQRLEMIFGKYMNNYAIILFTHGDALKNKTINIESEIRKNKSISKVIDQCGGRYHIFNNEDQGGKHQVTELLQKIDRMLEQNGGGCYTNEMLKEAEKHRKEDERNKNKKGFEEFYDKYKWGLHGGLFGGGTGLGAAVGAVVGGVLGGPVGAGIGAGIGLGVGAGIGLLTSAGIGGGMYLHKKAKNKRAEDQSTNTETRPDEDENASSHSGESQNPEDDSEMKQLINSQSKKQK